MDLSIIIPTINEEENLRALVPQINEVFAADGTSIEIVVIDGGSTDSTVQAAQELGCRVALQSGPSYAQAVRDGIAAVRGDYVIMMDADHSHRPEDARRLFRHRHLADIVVSSRYVPDGGTDTGWWRGALSYVLNRAYQGVLRLPFREVSGGFRIYRRDALTRIPLEARFYEVQPELIIRAHWLGYSVAEIPYRYRPRAGGSSKARVLKYGFNYLRALIRFARMKDRSSVAADRRPSRNSPLS